MYLDFTKFTKVDTNSRLTVTSTKIACAALQNPDTAYVYYDFGTDFFTGNFSYNFEVQWTSGDGNFYVFSLQNNIENLATLTSNSHNAINVVFNFGTGSKIGTNEYNAGSEYDGVSAYTTTTLTTYYCTVRRDTTVGTFGTFYVDVYSDAARTNLLATSSNTLHANVNYRYLFASNSYGSGSAANVITAFVQNLDIGIEDFTQYTKTDPNSRFAVTIPKITHTLLTSNENAYVYYDKGAGYFTGNMRFDFELNEIATVGGNQVAVFQIADAIKTLDGLSSGGNNGLIIIAFIDTTNIKMEIDEIAAGSRTFTNGVVGTINNVYYVTVQVKPNVGTYGTIYLDVYSDAAKTTNVLSLSQALTATPSLRYSFGTSSRNYADNSTITGLSQKLKISFPALPFTPSKRLMPNQAPKRAAFY